MLPTWGGGSMSFKVGAKCMRDPLLDMMSALFIHIGTKVSSNMGINKNLPRILKYKYTKSTKRGSKV